MKPIHQNTQGTLRSSNGFTLIELLLVITIIAILAALTISGMGYAQQAAARNRTLAALSAIKSGLETYKEKFGEYPTPKSPSETGAFGGGKTMVTGGAIMLYQALSGDGSDAINLGQNNGGSSSDGKVDTDELQNKVVGELPKAMVYHAASSTVYLLVDGFGRPFQYQKGSEADTINASSYDLWSYGTAPETSIPSSFPGLDEKKAKSATWIKNW
jgi:prepilin-type N-terminal cleavage/methylation domain-containing protein